MLFRLLVIAAVVYLGYRIVSRLGGGSSESRCVSCRHCGRLDEDGVICQYGSKQTFKTPVHIANCMDYAKR